jgi:hypothetical protein
VHACILYLGMSVGYLMYRDSGCVGPVNVYHSIPWLDIGAGHCRAGLSWSWSPTTIVIIKYLMSDK